MSDGGGVNGPPPTAPFSTHLELRGPGAQGALHEQCEPGGCMAPPRRSTTFTPPTSPSGLASQFADEEVPTLEPQAEQDSSFNITTRSNKDDINCEVPTAAEGSPVAAAICLGVR